MQRGPATLLLLISVLAAVTVGALNGANYKLRSMHSIFVKWVVPVTAKDLLICREIGLVC